jgi:hypothetical protein
MILVGKIDCPYGVMKYFMFHPIITHGIQIFLIFFIMRCAQVIGHLNSKERRALRLKYAQYHLINSMLFRRNYAGVLLRCLEKEDA